MCVMFAVGKTSNYVVLMANLVTRGKNEGIHAFIVQIRDENTHQPLKGSPPPPPPPPVTMFIAMKLQKKMLLSVFKAVDACV